MSPVDDHPLLGGCPESRQVLDPHRPVRETIGKSLGMLLGKQCRRHQHRDLATAGSRRERRAQRDFGLAEADVAADHAIHRTPGSHVCEHSLDRVVLIDRLLEGERGFERAVGFLVEFERTALAGGATRIEVEQFRGDVADTIGGALSRTRPLLGAEPVPWCGFRRTAGVAGHPIERVHRYVEEIATRVLDDEELGRIAGHLHHFEAAVAADAVLFVHDWCTGRKRRELPQDSLGIPLGAAAPALLARAFTE